MTDQFAAFAPVSGALSPTLESICNPSRAIAMIELHGTTDPRSPYTGGFTTAGYPIKSIADTIGFWTAKNQCYLTPSNKSLAPIVADGTTVDTSDYAGCSLGGNIKLVKINGGGHTWPQGLQYLPVSSIGVTSQQVNATSFIWDFLKQFSLP